MGKHFAVNVGWTVVHRWAIRRQVRRRYFKILLALDLQEGKILQYMDG